MGTLTKGYTFGATETVTNTKLHNLIDDGSVDSIVDADIAAGAAISWSKLDLSGSSTPGLSSAQTWTNTNTFSATLIASGTLIIGTTNHGDVFYDNGSATTRLTPGTTGQSLMTKGVAANPVWEYTTPPGSVISYAGATAPAGFLLCDGSDVSRTTYAVLYALIGFTYGADPGGGLFTLPNLKGKIVAGVDTYDADFTLANADGAKTHTLVAAELGEHTHNLSAPEAGHDATSVVKDSAAGRLTNEASAQSIGNDTYFAFTYGIKETHDGAHNNLQPYLTLNYIIKT